MTSNPPRGPVNARARAAQTRLVALMIAAIAAVAALAYWDEQRESEMALDHFAGEQATLAASAAAEVSARLDAAKRDAFRIAEDASLGRETPPSAIAAYSGKQILPAGTSRQLLQTPGTIALRVPVTAEVAVELTLPAADLVHDASRIVRPNELMLAVFPPDSAGLVTTDGRFVFAGPIQTAFGNGQSAVRLTRSEAAQLGLPARTAVAGMAAADGGSIGRFGIIVLASAAKERDRQFRARDRLLLSVLFAGGLVLSFGTLALRKQRKELDLLRRLELADLQQRRDERLDRANRAAMVGTIAAGVAHEISTPLAVISGRAEQLAGRLDDDERSARCVRLILEQTARISGIISGFLDFARVGRPTYSSVLPSDLARAAARLVEHRFEKAGVTLDVEADPHLLTIHCDMLLLEQAIVNLLLNACEACDRGGVVELLVRAHGDRVRFAVVDNGSGIAPADVSRVTEPFFTTKPLGKGTGLGLAITNEIVRGHRGTLVLSPDPAGGTRAVIEIPVEMLASDEPPLDRDGAPPTPSTGVEGAPS